MHPSATFFEVYDLKLINAQAGQHFFEPGSMRFFNSRVGSSAIRMGDVALFVTSERMQGEPRRYTARMMALTGERKGHVDKVPGTEFQQFASSKQAWSAIDAHCCGLVAG